MRKTVLTALGLMSVLAAAPASANSSNNGWVWQQGEADRREMERRIREQERQIEELQRQLSDLRGNPRTRVRTNIEPGGMRVWAGPGGMLMGGSRPKFGFVFHDSTGVDGAVVRGVSPGAPAARAGLRAGDVITMFNGIRLQGRESPAEEIRRQASDLDVGDTVQVEYRRGNDRKTITMVAEALDPDVMVHIEGDSAYPSTWPRNMQFNIPEMMDLGRFGARWLDVELVAVEKDLGEYFGATEGVLVVRAPRDSSLGLKAGDVILAIENRKATTPSQVMRILRSYEAGESFELQVMRQKRKQTVKAQIPVRDRGFYYQNDF